MAREGRSRGDLLLLVAVLASFGIAGSLYLTWQWYNAASASWCDLDTYFSCTKVRESTFAAIGGVPTAIVGVAGFAILLALGLLALRGRDALGPWPTTRWLLAFARPGAAVGLGPTLCAVFVSQALCILCVLGFALVLGILAVAAIWLR